jgi:hypothetical protein
MQSTSSPLHSWVPMPALMEGTKAKASLEMLLGVYDVSDPTHEMQGLAMSKRQC